MKSIGIFDSGVGGLTVFSQIEKLLPNEGLTYLGDTARVPYGTKSKATIERFAWEDAQFLLQRDIKLLIAACNTVSALALPFLRERLEIPILGVIEPAVKKALESTKTERIGVIGTRATIESDAYKKAFEISGPSIQLWSTTCPLFVPIVEENWIQEPETKTIAEKYLALLKRNKIDTLILGCTHYPLLRSIIQDVMGPDVTLIDSAESIAIACQNQLYISDLTDHNAQPGHQFFVTDEAESFRKKGEKFLGHPIENVERIDLETTKILCA